MIPHKCLNSPKCYFIWNSIPIYIDNNHLSLQFTKTLTKRLLKYVHFQKQKTKDNLNCNFTYMCSYKVIKRV